MELESLAAIDALIDEAKAAGSDIAHATIKITFTEDAGDEARTVLLTDLVEVSETTLSYLSEGETVNVPMDDVAYLVISTADADDVELDV